MTGERWRRGFRGGDEATGGASARDSARISRPSDRPAEWGRAGAGADPRPPAERRRPSRRDWRDVLDAFETDDEVDGVDWEDLPGRRGRRRHVDERGGGAEGEE